MPMKIKKNKEEARSRGIHQEIRWNPQLRTQGSRQKLIPPMREEVKGNSTQRGNARSQETEDLHVLAYSSPRILQLRQSSQLHEKRKF